APRAAARRRHLARHRHVLGDRRRVAGGARGARGATRELGRPAGALPLGSRGVAPSPSPSPNPSAEPEPEPRPRARAEQDTGPCRPGRTACERVGMDWRPDVLGGFEQLPLTLPDDEEGAVVATLVRPTAAKAASSG